MEDLARWVDEVGGAGRPVFVGFNAPFDWMFVADYCWRFLGRNPFGYAALDLKALYMGRDGIDRWASTGKADVTRRYPVTEPHTHHALDDARMQAALARRLLHRRALSAPGRTTRQWYHGAMNVAPLHHYRLPSEPPTRAVAGPSPRPPLYGRRPPHRPSERRLAITARAPTGGQGRILLPDPGRRFICAPDVVR